MSVLVHRWKVILWVVIVGLFLLSGGTMGQVRTKPVEGIRDNTPQVHALVNARIVQGPGRLIEKGTVVLRDGVIEAVGENVSPPPDARIWDYEGYTVYPGLIDLYSHVGLPERERRKPGEAQPGGRTAQQRTRRGAEHWNPKVHPERDVAQLYKPDKKDLDKLRGLGFTAALVVPKQGIFRGTSVLVSLGDGDPSDEILRERVAQHLAFERGRFGDRTYPNSLMGAIALIRQTFLDAQWYRDAQEAYRINPKGQTRPEVNLALEALRDAVQGRQPVMIEVDDELNFLRAVKIAQEFGLQLWVRGSGYEYRRLDWIKQANVPIVLPLNFPEAPDVESPEEALNVTLAELSHWEAAPENPKRLHEAGVTFAVTTATLKKPSEFRNRVRQAIERGLPKDVALAALTTVPARLLGMEKQLGSIDVGKLANLVITDGDLFDKETKIYETWIKGKRYEVKRRPKVDPRGKWEVLFSFPQREPLRTTLQVTGKVERLKGTLKRGKIRIKLQKVTLDDRRMTLVFAGDSLGYKGVIRLSGRVEKKRLTGYGELPDGRRFGWSAEWRAKVEPKESRMMKQKKEGIEAAPPPVYPQGAYGRARLPEQPRYVLVRGATIWTCGPQGKLEQADMLVKEGKILRIGQNLKAPAGAVIIDARGKHVTPGLIDAHSHTAISGGVNESAQVVSAEVRIQDVINPDDIAIYRELAGGLTTANLLHGSANPIGGQNAVIKLRWGASPDEMLFKGAPPTIKFALGENPKQSNWRDRSAIRYPQTRMGVEQIIRDRFKAALDYKKAWEKYNSLRKKTGVIPPRRDLELEALVEVLEGKRYVHCHSYRQDEILMLMRVAEDFGFQVRVFQHVLEGYKVADIMARHGAGASTFSDWWAYKFEVYDAIPYNGALMHNAGVVVSYNSDSKELARRLNTEAAKAVKYGGVSEEEALKFVTLNPAIQLGIDHRVGSLEPGKDADFVIWSGHPLSTYTICEQTWIDGRKYFDREEDLKMRKQVEAERARLIQKVLASKKKPSRKEEAEKKTRTTMVHPNNQEVQP